MTKKELQAKLLAKRQVDENTQCWIWIGAWNDQKGGVIYLPGDRKNQRGRSVAKLAAWAWLNAKPTQFIGHLPTCPMICFNPEHLQLFPSRSAMTKARAKSLATGVGFDNPHCRLTPYALELIVEGLIEGMETYNELAARVQLVTSCSINKRQVFNIASGRAWSHAISPYLSSKFKKRRKECSEHEKACQQFYAARPTPDLS